MMMGESEKAVADFNTALKINPNNSNALYGRGLVKSRMGDKAAGDADIARAKRLQANVAEYFARHGVK
jgi:Flp pilus assembly protein TadD